MRRPRALLRMSFATVIGFIAAFVLDAAVPAVAAGRRRDCHKADVLSVVTYLGVYDRYTATIPNDCTTLDMNNDGTGDRGATAVAEALKGNTVLTELYMGGNMIGDTGAAAIADALKGNSALKELYLFNNRIGDSGATSIAEALKHNIAKIALRTLHLEGNNIGDSGAAAIAAALKGNNIERRGFKARTNPLKTLHLERNNNIGDRGAAAIAEALKHNNALTSLHIENKRIGDDGAAAFASALNDNAALTELHLSFNNIKDGAIADNITKSLAENNDPVKRAFKRADIKARRKAAATRNAPEKADEKNATDEKRGPQETRRKEKTRMPVVKKPLHPTKRKLPQPEDPITLKGTDLSKLSVKELRGILARWDDACKGCVEKNNFLMQIKQNRKVYGDMEHVANSFRKKSPPKEPEASDDETKRDSSVSCCGDDPFCAWMLGIETRPLLEENARLKYENDALKEELKWLNQNLIQDDDSEDVYDSEEVHEEL